MRGIGGKVSFWEKEMETLWVWVICLAGLLKACGVIVWALGVWPGSVKGGLGGL